VWKVEAKVAKDVRIDSSVYKEESKNRIVSRGKNYERKKERIEL